MVQLFAGNKSVLFIIAFKLNLEPQGDKRNHAKFEIPPLE